MDHRFVSILSLAVAGALTFGATQANAVTYGFENLTNNGGPDVGGQLSLEVTDAGGGQVSFQFNNTGPAASSITDVYFDDGTLLGIAGISDSGAGVDFSAGASPGNLPGGNSIGFDATFAADSNPPTQPMGVSPGEYLIVLFDLIGGSTFADTLAAIGLGDLRVGIHVQGLTGGGSDSYVNNPAPVPIPPALALFGGGLVGIALLARRKLKSPTNAAAPA